MNMGAVSYEIHSESAPIPGLLIAPLQGDQWLMEAAG